MLPWITIALLCALVSGGLLITYSAIGYASNQVRGDRLTGAILSGGFLFLAGCFGGGLAFVNRNSVKTELFTVTSVTTTSVVTADSASSKTDKTVEFTSSWKRPQAADICLMDGIDCSKLDIGDTVAIEHVYPYTGNWGSFDRVGKITKNSS